MTPLDHEHDDFEVFTLNITPQTYIFWTQHTWLGLSRFFTVQRITTKYVDLKKCWLFLFWFGLKEKMFPFFTIEISHYCLCRGISSSFLPWRIRIYIGFTVWPPWRKDKSRRKDEVQPRPNGSILYGTAREACQRITPSTHFLLMILNVNCYLLYYFEICFNWRSFGTLQKWRNKLAS